MNRAARRASGFKKIFPDDKGPMELAMAIKDDQIVVEFGVTLKWFSMGIPEAEGFLQKFQERLEKLKEQAKSKEQKATD